MGEEEVRAVSKKNRSIGITESADDRKDLEFLGLAISTNIDHSPVPDDAVDRAILSISDPASLRKEEDGAIRTIFGRLDSKSLNDEDDEVR